MITIYTYIPPTPPACAEGRRGGIPLNKRLKSGKCSGDMPWLWSRQLRHLLRPAKEGDTVFLDTMLLRASQPNEAKFTGTQRANKITPAIG